MESEQIPIDCQWLIDDIVLEWCWLSRVLGSCFCWKTRQKFIEFRLWFFRCLLSCFLILMFFSVTIFKGSACKSYQAFELMQALYLVDVELIKEELSSNRVSLTFKILEGHKMSHNNKTQDWLILWRWGLSFLISNVKWNRVLLWPDLIIYQRWRCREIWFRDPFRQAWESS